MTGATARRLAALVTLLISLALLPAAPAGGAGAGYGGYVVDAYGGLHAFGGATRPSGGPYWPGQDIARGIDA